MTNEQYYELIKPYGDAGQILLTRLQILNHNIYKTTAEKPIHNIQDRMKDKKSLEAKLRHRGYRESAEDARDYIQDVSGIRVICYFTDDIYNLIHMIKHQTDLVIIKESDYISEPKPNGYQSYHVVFGVPVYCLDAMEYYPVEVQFRTISMDFWASMEHRICYKKFPDNREELAAELLEYSNILKDIEARFERYNTIGKIKINNK